MNTIKNKPALNIEDGLLKIQLAESQQQLQFSCVWLRDNCRCQTCYNHETYQRNISILDIPLDIYPNNYEILESGQVVRITSLNIEDGLLKIQLAESQQQLQFSCVWLRDNCRCQTCYNHETYQRNISILDIPLDIYPNNYEILESGQVVRITWSDGHESKYDINWLHNQLLMEVRPETILWSGNIEDKVAHVPKSDIKTDLGITRLVKSLLQYGVGFVTEVPNNVEATEEVVRCIAPPQRTMFGDMWHVRSNLMDHLDTAYTSVKLGAHNDTTYFIDSAGLIIFHCVHHDGKGGETLLVDGFRAAEDVRMDNSLFYKCLQSVAVEFQFIGIEHFHACTSPVLRFSEDSQLEQIRFNIYDRSTRLPVQKNQVDMFYKSLRALASAVYNPAGEWWFKLKPGTVAFVNNWRVMHGRSSFTGKRHLIGSYISMADFLSRARVLRLIV